MFGRAGGRLFAGGVREGREFGWGGRGGAGQSAGRVPWQAG